MAETAEPEELELRDYLRVLRRRKWLIAAVTVVVVGAALAASFAQTPVYRASAQVLLESRVSESLFNPSTGQRNDPAREVDTQIHVIESRPVRDLVQKKLGSVPDVSASAVGQTDVIQLSVESTDAKRAADVANAYVEAYRAFRTTQVQDDYLAAIQQVQDRIADLQHQIDALVPVGGKPADADTEARRQALLQQQVALQARLGDLQTNSQLSSGGVQPVTPATEPGSPVRPAPKRNAAVALALGLVLGVGLAFLFEYLDDTIRGRDDVERVGAGLPVVGTIPPVPGWKDRKQPVLVAVTQPKSMVAEAYRSLRTSVQFLGLDRPLKTLQITSPSAGEGKTVTAANLGVTMANAGQRVVVVGCDLRKPRVHAFFGLDNTVGFTDVLKGEVPLSAALQAVPDVPNLAVLASGPPPPNPSEILGGGRAGEVLDALRASSDLVILDSAPVLPVTDAAVLAARADATLVVAVAGETHRKRLQQALDRLAQVGAPLAGIVLNEAREEGGYGYGYRYGYYAYGAEGNGRRGRDRDRAPVEK